MRLTKGEIDDRIKMLKGWKVDEDEIEKKFEFKDFKQSMEFVNMVADAAEAEDHHPDIEISYNKVEMSLSTHSEGGLTDKDFMLAARIDEVAGSFT